MCLCVSVRLRDCAPNKKKNAQNAMKVWLCSIVSLGLLSRSASERPPLPISALITSFHKTGWHASRSLVSAIHSTSSTMASWDSPLYKQIKQRASRTLVNSSAPMRTYSYSGLATGFGGDRFARCALCAQDILVGACADPRGEDCRACCEGRARTLWRGFDSPKLSQQQRVSTATMNLIRTGCFPLFDTGVGRPDADMPKETPSANVLVRHIHLVRDPFELVRCARLSLYSYLYVCTVA